MRCRLTVFYCAILRIVGGHIAAKDDDSWLSDLDKSGWMDHIRKLLRTAAHMTHLIISNSQACTITCR